MSARHEKRTLLETLCMGSTIAVGGASIITLGLIIGLATNNAALMSISLSIGIGGAIGWLIAGGLCHRTGKTRSDR